MAWPTTSIDPELERRLRDEIIYLHSLWYQAPPHLAAAVRHRLQPLQTTQFKRKGTAAESNSSPGPEWPIQEPKPDPSPQLVTPEEQSKLASKNAHRTALKAVAQFLTAAADDDSDAIAVAGDDDDDDDDDDDESAVDYSTFFHKLFDEDAQLREFYANHYADGVFPCLVCGGLGGRKKCKNFKGCLPLVQHSITLSNTKNRKAHRALGQAILQVLNWKMDQLPAIASLLNKNSALEEGNVAADGVANVEDDHGGLDAGNVPKNDHQGNVNSSASPNVENPRITASEGFTSVTPVEIPGVGNECRDW
ncbi:uncharacterized protein LOC127247123 [Andrographis paniculata]|uniref:uncharacterized protein LOC127247123 n=1 Tax=Andrographis paniculata TaxID=175694 RepID=UPI0021E78FC8|nr:uncharacterized protein LOC127247123 [Andrographis paniculata]